MHKVKLFKPGGILPFFRSLPVFFQTKTKSKTSQECKSSASNRTIFCCFFWGGRGVAELDNVCLFSDLFIGDIPFNISKAEMSLLRRAVGVKLGFQEFPNYKVSQRFSLNLKVSLTIEFYWERLYVNNSLQFWANDFIPTTIPFHQLHNDSNLSAILPEIPNQFSETFCLVLY